MDTPAPVAQQSPGRVVHPLRAAWLRVEGQWMWYRRYWRSNLYSSGLQPLLFLAAMGLGFGSQVEPGPDTGGVDYLHFVAPTLLVSGAMMIAVFESTWKVASGFQWQRQYVAVISTPITPGQVFGGELMWVGMRLLLSAVVYGVVAGALGAWLGPGALLVVLVGVLTGLACAAPIMALSATVRNPSNAFSALLRFVVMPVMLFSGTFFPISYIPVPARMLAWISPLWHGNELARAAALGGGEWLPLAGHGAFLVVLLLGGGLLARSRFYRRLVV
ncbi:ABC transporter permease [Haloechinothrix sp. YIM 98757]|uniref:Transport permease protein n=1 Tax=Haloechinothrix aidingensis TaxID=2752311 RepID=A0A838AAU8_9PSEU|nr:ABC transporter permease [Haloechinothrix aidingensis]MBA0126347.1 ABC transporter permease [Haloechinothrix aidingensis]